MYIAAINMQKKYDKKNNTTEYKPLSSKPINKCEYKIIVNSKKNENELNQCELMLNTKMIDWIKIRHDNKIYEIHKIPYYGIKINFDNSIKPLIITIKPKDYCSSVNIWETKKVENCELVNISWDKIYIINLKRRQERMEKMIAQMEKFGIDNYEFIEAVDGNDPEIQEEFKEQQEKNKFLVDKNQFIITSGHYGCLKSHLKAIKKAKADKLENVMILEDDVIFDEDFLNKIGNKKVPEYDLLYLGGVSRSLKIYFDEWGSAKHIMGTYGYILNHKLYNKILIDLSRNPIYIDTYYVKNIQDNKNFKSYILNDYIKTTVDTSDTSSKNSVMMKPLDYINKFEEYGTYKIL